MVGLTQKCSRWLRRVQMAESRSVTDLSADQPVVAEREETRSNGPMTGGERAVLDHWLDLYRETVMLKIAGPTAKSLAHRPLPRPSMSLIPEWSGTSREWRRIGSAAYFSTSRTCRTITARRQARTATSTTPRLQQRRLMWRLTETPCLSPVRTLQLGRI